MPWKDRAPQAAHDWLIFGPFEGRAAPRARLKMCLSSHDQDELRGRATNHGLVELSSLRRGGQREPSGTRTANKPLLPLTAFAETPFFTPAETAPPVSTSTPEAARLPGSSPVEIPICGSPIRKARLGPWPRAARFAPPAACPTARRPAAAFHVPAQTDRQTPVPPRKSAGVTLSAPMNTRAGTRPWNRR